jgi:uncharacterized protein (TIGR03067 family)
MKGLSVTLSTCLVLGLGFQLAHAADPPSDKDAIQGTWKMVSRESRGQSRDAEGSKMVFKGDRFQMIKDGDVKIEGTFKIDPATKPRSIDMKVEKATDDVHVETKTSLGIYELNGDDLRWCADEPGHETRPTEFSSQAEGHMLVVLKREAK